MVSILLATYRGETYLPALAESLLGQEYTDFRVLWQDDGGDAPPLPHDGRFVPGANSGKRLGAAGNFFDLMAQDDAPYTALCDQDDVWHAGRLARCMEAMQAAERESGADTPLLVHSDCRLIGADGTLLHGSFFRHQGWDGGAVTLNRLIVQNNVTGCTVLMNAALRRLVVTHLPDAPVLHDWWIALTAAAFGRVIFLPDTLVDYRQHGANVIGASRAGLLTRALSAAKAPAKARERIHLTYDMARRLKLAYGDALPAPALTCLDAYLATEQLPKWRRVRAVRRDGYRMQSPLTRLGQIIFG